MIFFLLFIAIILQANAIKLNDSKNYIVWNRAREIFGNNPVDNKLKGLSIAVSSLLNEHKERIEVLETKVKFLTERLEAASGPH